MRDLKEETLAGMLKDGVPEDVPEGQQATADAVRAIAAGDVAGRPELQPSHWQTVESHALCFRKWGMEYVRDITAWTFFCVAKKDCGDDAMAAHAAGMVLPMVDWVTMEKLFRENWESYRDERRRRGTDKGIGAGIAQLRWALGSRGIPGVREPGDLYRAMAPTPGPAN